MSPTVVSRDGRPVLAIPAVGVADGRATLSAGWPEPVLWDLGRPELLRIDVELLEVNRSRMLDYGLQFASPGTSNPAGVSGSVDVNRAGLTLLDLKEAGIGISLTRALDFAHRKGIVHSDMKSDNIMISKEALQAEAGFGEHLRWRPIGKFGIDVSDVNEQEILQSRIGHAPVSLSDTGNTG